MKRHTISIELFLHPTSKVGLSSMRVIILGAVWPVKQDNVINVVFLQHLLHCGQE